MFRIKVENLVMW